MERERVLVIRFGALGDLALATAVLEALSRERPRPAIELVTKNRWAPLLADDPRLDALHAFDGDLPRLLRGVRDHRYGRVLDLQGNLRSRVVSWAARAERVARVDRRRRQRRALLRGGAPSPRLAGGVLGWYGEIVGSALPRPCLDPTRREAQAAALLSDAGIDEAFVAIAPSAGRPTKEWPPHRFAELLARQSDERGGALGGRRMALVGAPSEAARLRAIAAPTATPVLTPQLAELPAILARAELLLTGDTGPMHVAEAVGTPVVALFGPTVAGFGFAPIDPQSVRLERELPCRPCSLHGGRECPLGHHDCLAGIDADTVLAAMRGLLQRSRPGEPSRASL